LDLAEKIIGPDIALFASHYIAKPPGEGQQVLWHQDGSYWPLEPMEVVTGWLAVNESTPENGCMRVIPGTHVTDLKTLIPRKDVPNVLSSEMPLEYVDEALAVDVVLNPGDISLHHPNLVHASDANTSSSWRKGLTIRYVPTTTQIKRGADEPDGILLRGRPVEGINSYVDKPKYSSEKSMPFTGTDSRQ